MPPTEDAASQVARRNAQLYEPEHNTTAFRGDVRLPSDGQGLLVDRMMREGYDRSLCTLNDHRNRSRFEDPRNLAYGALQTESQFGFDFAKPKYMAAITAADRISQRHVYCDRCCICQRMQCIDLSLARQADGCCRNRFSRRMSPCTEQNLRGQRQGCLQDEDRLWGLYLSPGTTRCQAGLRFIANGKVEEGEKLVKRGLELRPEIGQDQKFQRMLAEARAQGQAVRTDVRQPPDPVRAPNARDFYNFYGGNPEPAVPRTQFGPTPPPDRSTRFRPQPLSDRPMTFVPPRNPQDPALGPDIRQPGARRPEVGPPRPQGDVRPGLAQPQVSEADKVFPYSKNELARRERSTMEYVTRMAPGFRGFNPPSMQTWRDVAANPPRRNFPTFPAIEPPVPPVQQPTDGPAPVNPTPTPSEGFGRKDQVVGGKNFWETVKEYAKKDWVQGLAIILAGLGAIKGYEIYRSLGADVVRQHIENPDQVKVTVDTARPESERGVRAYDRLTGAELTKRTADGKYFEVDRPGGTPERIPVQDIDRIRYEIVAGSEREVKVLKAQLELDLKGLHDRAKMVGKLDVQFDPAMTEKQKFVFTEGGVEVGTIEGMNADGTLKVKLADGSVANKTVTADSALVLKVKDSVAEQKKLAGADIAEFMKIASPTVTLKDWTRMQGEVREQKTKEMVDKLQQALDESKRAHEETKQKLNEAKRQLEQQKELNETERKKATAEIDSLQKQLDKASEAVQKAEERLKSEAEKHQAAVKEYQETKTKLEQAQRDLAALAETEAEKRAELDKQIKQLSKDLTKNSQALDEVNKKLVQQIEETTKSRDQAQALTKQLDAVQQRLTAEQQRVQQLEKALQERDAEIKRVSDANVQAERNAQESERRRAELEKQLTDAKADLSAAKKELEGKTGTDAALKEATEKLADLQKRYDAALKEAETIQKQLQAENTERARIAQELVKANEALTAARQQLSDLKTKSEADQKAIEKVAADLQTKVAELTTKQLESDKRLQEKDAEQQRLTTELKEARIALQDAQIKMGGDAGRIADLQKQLGEREAELKQAQEARRTAEERARQAEQERAARDTALEQIKTELDAAKQALDKKQGTEAELSDARAKMTELQLKYESAVKSRDEFQQRLETEQTERARQVDLVTQLQEQLTKAQTDLRQLADKATADKAAAETAARETAARLQTQLTEATEKLKQSEQRVNDALEKQRQIGIELDQARTALKDAAGKISGDAATIATMQRQLEAAKEAERLANERAAEAERQRTARDTELTQIKNELDAAKQALEKKQGTEAQLAEAQEKLTQLQTKYDGAVQARDSFQRQLETEQAERSKQVEAVKQLREQLAQAQADLKAAGEKAEADRAAAETNARENAQRLQAQLSDATEKLKQSEQRVATLVEEQKRIGTELDQARAALKDAAGKLSGDAATINSLQRQLEAAKEAERLANERAGEAERQRTARDAELTKVKDQLSAARAELEKKQGTEAALADANTKLTKLQTEYDEAVQARDEFARKLKAEEIARNEASQAVQKLQEQLTQAQSELKDIGTRSADERRAAEQRAQTLQTQLAEATTKLQQSEQRVAAAQQEQQRVGTELEQARTALSEAATKMAADAKALADLQRQIEELNRRVTANDTARQEAETRAGQEERQRKAAEQKVTELQRTIEQTTQKLQQLDAAHGEQIQAVRTQLEALKQQHEAAKTELQQATQKAEQEATARQQAEQQAQQAKDAVADVQRKLAAADKTNEAERTRLQSELTQAQTKVQEAQDALKQIDERLKAQTRAGEALQARLTQAEAALADAVSKLPAPPSGGGTVKGKPINTGGDNYRPIAREGDSVTLLNIDKIPEGREQQRTKAEIESMFERKVLNLDGTAREYLVEKPKTDGRPVKVYALTAEATDSSAGKVKLVGEMYVRKLSDKAGTTGQTYQEWLADYDANKGTTQVQERMRPGIQGNVGTTASTTSGTAGGDGGTRPTGSTSGDASAGSTGTTGGTTGGDTTVTTTPPAADATVTARLEALREINNRLSSAPGEGASADVKAAIDDAIAQNEADPAKKALVEELNRLKTRYATEAKAVNESISTARTATVPTPSAAQASGPSRPLPDLAYDRTSVSGGNVTGDQHTTGNTGDRAGLTQEDVRELETQKATNQTRLKAIEAELAKDGLDPTQRRNLETEQRRLMAENSNIERAKTDPVLGARLKSLARVAGPVGAAGILIITLRHMFPDPTVPSTIPHQRWGVATPGG